jgi:hypothetical protein
MVSQLRRPLVILLVFALLAVTAPREPAQRSNSSLAQTTGGTMPDGLMSAFLTASSRSFAVDTDGHRAYSGGLDLRLNADGLQANVSGLVWGLALRAVRRGEHAISLPEAKVAQAADRTEFRRGVLTEWYRDTALGAEQGFTIDQSPPGRGPLVLQLEVSTELSGAADGDGQGLSFAAPDGSTLRYDHLRAWDADGMPLEAQLHYLPGRVTLEVNDQEAAYPLTIDPLIYLEQRVTASDSVVVRQFGYSVALWGDTALVGAPYDNVNANAYQGSVYVFARSGTTWVKQARLTATNGKEYETFGSSVALWEDTALVGAPGDQGATYDKGSAYVFVRSGTAWSEQAHLTASDGTERANFGGSVALWGNTALVGASGDDFGGHVNLGSAYVYTWSGAAWTEQQKLVASDGWTDDGFGQSVALWDDTILVGARADTVGANTHQGSAYIFAWSGTTWSEQAHLTASDGEAYQGFGYSVALWEDSALVGAAYGDSAYVYVRSDATWSDQQKLTPPESPTGGWFGSSVALWDDTALVGALMDNVASNRWQGSAYVFTRSDTTWSEQAHLIASDGAAEDGFGGSVALCGDIALIGASSDDVNENADQGSAYAFARSDTTWSEEQQVIVPDVAGDDHFGWSVALWEDTALVGAPNDNIGANSRQGSVYVFVREGMAWVEQQKLAALDGEAEDRLGHSVAVWGDTAVVAAPWHSVDGKSYQGSVYVFVRSGTTWSEQARLTASDGGAGDQFGTSVALYDHTVVVGVAHDTVDGNYDQGSAYVFVRSGTTWSEQAHLIASDGALYDSFGWSVAAWNDTVLVGAPGNTVSGAYGSVYVYSRSGTTWSQQARLTASDGERFDRFGWSVALSSDSALVGAYHDNVGDNGLQGSAYVFARTDTTWSEEAHLTASDGETSDQFGHSVALGNDTALVGAMYDRSAYTFGRRETTWTEQARVAGSGWSVALWGKTVLAGAPDDTIGIGPYQGTAYFFAALPSIIRIACLDPSPTDATSVRFGVTFSEDVTGVDISDFASYAAGALNGVEVTDVSGSGSTYTVTLSTGIGSGTLRLDVPTSATIAALDGGPLAGLPYTGDEMYTVDRTAPAVVSLTTIDADPTRATELRYAVAFSEDVNGVDASDFALTTTGSISDAVVAAVIGSGAHYTVTVSTGTGDGTLRLDLPAGAVVSDLVGNLLSGLPCTSGEVYTVDKTAPVVQSVVRTDTNPTYAPSVSFAMSFSEEVTGIDASDFGPSTTGSISSVQVTSVTGSGADYIITVSTGTGDGTLRLDVLSGTAIADLAGNPLSGLPYAIGEAYTIDKTAPAVLFITRADSDPTSAPTVRFAMTFSEAVTGVDASDLVLTTNGSLSGAAVASVSGSGATYTVTVSTGSGSGTLGLGVRFTATITDLADNWLSGLPYTASEVYTVDKAAPAILSITRMDPDPARAPSVHFAVTYSKSVTGVDATDFLPSITGSLSGASVVDVSGSGTTYAVTVSTGTGGGTLRLDVAGNATITDLAGNPLSSLPYTGGEVYAILYTVYLPLVVRTVP